MHYTQQRHKSPEFGDFHFGVARPLEDEDLQTIVRAIRSPIDAPRGVLGGRGVISEARLSDGSSVLVKHYRRGGILRRVVDSLYIRLGKPRPQSEFDLLHFVGGLGGVVPEPIAYVTRGSFIYQGWLVMGKIENARSLADISVEDVPRAVKVLQEVVRQVSLMIENRICHVDLHPGNVLVDPAGKVYLIDFDKAYFFKGKKKKLRDKYLCRWRRAILKHELPEFLIEGLCGGILRDFDSLESQALHVAVNPNTL